MCCRSRVSSSSFVVRRWSKECLVSEEVGLVEGTCCAGQLAWRMRGRQRPAGGRPERSLKMEPLGGNGWPLIFRRCSSHSLHTSPQNLENPPHTLCPQFSGLSLLDWRWLAGPVIAVRLVCLSVSCVNRLAKSRNLPPPSTTTSTTFETTIWK